MKSIERQIIEKMNEIDSHFFDSFNERITSGDHFSVQSAMVDGVEILENAIFNIPEIAVVAILGRELAEKMGPDIQNFIEGDGSLNSEELADYVKYNYPDYDIQSSTFLAVAVVAVVVFTAAIMINYAAYVNVYSQAAVFEDYWGPEKQSANKFEKPSLQQEIIIDDIVRYYGKID